MAGTRETWGEIYNYTLDRLRVSSDRMGKFNIAQICRVINHVQHVQAMILARHGDQYIGTYALGSLVSGQEIYSIGEGGDFNITDFLKMKHICVIVTADQEEPKLDKVDIEDREKYLVTPSDEDTSSLRAVAYYYHTTTTLANSAEKIPALGLLPVPKTSGTNVLKLHYYYKPRPIEYSGSAISNKDQVPDLPETSIPALKTQVENMLLEADRSSEKMATVAPRLMEEKALSKEANVDQSDDDDADRVQYWEDPAVDW